MPSKTPKTTLPLAPTIVSDELVEDAAQQVLGHAPDSQESAAGTPAEVKTVRLTVRFPAQEYDRLRCLKKRLQALGINAKKTELIRAGLRLLEDMPDARLATAMDALHSRRLVAPKSLGRVHLKPKKT